MRQGRRFAGSHASVLADAALAVGASVLSLGLVSDVDGWRPGAVVLVLVHTLSLGLRRLAPRTCLALVLGSGLAYSQLDLPLVALGPWIVVPVYTVAASGGRRTSVAGLLAAEGALALAVAGTSTRVDTWVVDAAIVAVAWFLGDNVRRRQEAASALAERAALLERARDDLARQAVAEERLRIARELHDVVAHAMSVIAVQSGVGAHVIDSQPEEARRALLAIETTSRSALDEMRRLLGVLREDDGARAGLTPAPGLDDLDGLVAEAAASGLSVDVAVEGRRPDVPQGLDLSAFRIVQEALTNVRRHAGATAARVVVRYSGDEVALEVTDDGRGGPVADGTGTARGGHGIIGMRERAAVFGGTVDAGPRPEGGFRVAARIPVPAPRR